MNYKVIQVVPIKDFKVYICCNEPVDIKEDSRDEYRSTTD